MPTFFGADELRFVLALQAAGLVIGVAQGLIGVGVTRLRTRLTGHLPGAGFHPIATLRLWLSGGFTALLAALTLAAAVGSGETLATLFIVVNLGLPVIGSIVFVVPPWAFAAQLTRRVATPG